MDLLVLISGNYEKALATSSVDCLNYELLKIDEKHLYKPLKIKNILNSKYRLIYWICFDLKYQRFLFFINLYSVLFAFGKVFIIDEKGTTFKLNIQALIKNSFVLLFELFLSGVLIFYYTIKLLFYKL